MVIVLRILSFNTCMYLPDTWLLLQGARGGRGFVVVMPGRRGRRGCRGCRGFVVLSLVVFRWASKQQVCHLLDHWVLAERALLIHP